MHLNSHLKLVGEMICCPSIYETRVAWGGNSWSSMMGRYGDLLYCSLYFYVCWNTPWEELKMNQKKANSNNHQNQKLCQNLAGIQSKATNSQSPLAADPFTQIMVPVSRSLITRAFLTQVGDFSQHGLLSLTELEKMAVSGWFLSPGSEVKYCYQELTVAIWLKVLEVMVIPLSF